MSLLDSDGSCLASWSLFSSIIILFRVLRARYLGQFIDLCSMQSLLSMFELFSFLIMLSTSSSS